MSVSDTHLRLRTKRRREIGVVGAPPGRRSQAARIADWRVSARGRGAASHSGASSAARRRSGAAVGDRAQESLCRSAFSVADIAAAEKAQRGGEERARKGRIRITEQGEI